MTSSYLTVRNDLLVIFKAAIQAVGGRRCVEDYLRTHPMGSGPIALLAMGKAASAMTGGAVYVLGEQIVRGLVITKDGHCQGEADLKHIQCFEAGHPYPDARSLSAGQKVLEFIHAAPADAQFLVLISGGVSALVEVLPAGWGIDDLTELNHWLLASGLNIKEVNRVRRLVSSIKGGRLAKHLTGHDVVNLLISDVPGDDPVVIGSGLLAPDQESDTTRKAMLKKLCLGGDAPNKLHNIFQHQMSVPEATDPCFSRIHTAIIANNQQACVAAASAGRTRGYDVHQHSAPLAGEAIEMGEHIVNVLKDAEPGLHIWGGETTVVLPAQPGRGGRNQSLALATACQLKNIPRICLLAVGTDGTDGPSEDAGALIDGDTVVRGEAQGLTAKDYLNNADAGTFFEKTGDLVRTGPTGTNVMDLVLAIKA